MGAALGGDVHYIDKERITDYLQGVASHVPSLQRYILDQKLVYPKSISDSSANIQKFLYYINNFPDIVSGKDKKFLNSLGGEETSQPEISMDTLRKIKKFMAQSFQDLFMIFPSINYTFVLKYT